MGACASPCEQVQPPGQDASGSTLAAAGLQGALPRRPPPPHHAQARPHHGGVSGPGAEAGTQLGRAAARDPPRLCRPRPGQPGLAAGAAQQWEAVCTGGRGRLLRESILLGSRHSRSQAARWGMSGCRASAGSLGANTPALEPHCGRGTLPEWSGAAHHNTYHSAANPWDYTGTAHPHDLFMYARHIPCAPDATVCMPHILAPTTFQPYDLPPRVLTKFFDHPFLCKGHRQSGISKQIKRQRC